MTSFIGEEHSVADHVDGCDIEVNVQLNSIISYSYEPIGIHEYSDHKRNVWRSTPAVDGSEHVGNNTWVETSNI